MRSSFFVKVIVALLSLIVIAGCAYDPSKHSTAGVTLVSEAEGIAKIPAGETLVLKHSRSCGRHSVCTDYWRFSYADGKLTVSDDNFPEDRVREFAVQNGTQTEISTYWLADPLYATLDDDGTVRVDWPSGFWSSWDYR